MILIINYLCSWSVGQFVCWLFIGRFPIETNNSEPTKEILRAHMILIIAYLFFYFSSYKQMDRTGDISLELMRIYSSSE